MSIYVVDASVAVKWFFEEAHSENALRLLNDPHQLHAPDFLWMELASVACQRVRRKEISSGKGLQILLALRHYPIRIFPSADLLDAATAIALETATSPYDCVYIALAVSLDAQTVTADRRFYQALAKGRFANRGLWIGDLP